MPTILFVCTANQFRSPIAAACFLRKLTILGIQSDWKVGSAGIWGTPGLSAHPKAVEAAKEIGLDISKHRTRLINVNLVNSADVIAVMESRHEDVIEAEFPQARERIVLLGKLSKVFAGEITDPAKDKFSQPEVAARLMNTCIDQAFTKLVQFAETRHIKQKI